MNKESACNAGDPSWIPGLRNSPGEGIGYPLQYFLGFLGSSDGKESACNARGPGSIPGSGRSSGEVIGYPFLPGKFHGQRTLADWIVHGFTKYRI